MRQNCKDSYFGDLLQAVQEKEHREASAFNLLLTRLFVTHL